MPDQLQPHVDTATVSLDAPRAQVLAVVLGILVFLSGSLAIAGGTPWPVIALASIACLLVLAARIGYLIAVSVSILIGFSAIMVTLLISAALWTQILPATGTAFTALGVFACVLLAGSPVRLLHLSRSTRRDVVASLSGAVVWAIALLVSVRVPLAERLTWVMRNDSLNNLIYAHYILRERGIELRPNLNPTPLPAALVALGIVSGRPSASPTLSLQHDLIGMAVTWVALIALVSVVLGLTAAAIVRRVVGSGLASHAAGAGGSLIALSWYVTGYPIEYGFLNLDVVVPVILASILLALVADRLPWLSVSALLVAATLMLATWSPLVAVPLALLALTVFRQRDSLRRSGRWGLVAMVVGVVQLLAYGILATLPAYLAQRSALAGIGGIYADNHFVVFFAGAAVIALGFFVFRADRSKFLALCVTVVAPMVSLALLLFISRRNPDPWTYYPIKLAYFSTVAFIALLVGLSVAFLAQHASRVALLWIGGATVVVLEAGLLVAVPGIDQGLVRMNPLVRLTSSHPEERYVQPDTMVQILARTNKPALLWASRIQDEPWADLWLLQLRADTLSGTSRLRIAAYNQTGVHTVRELCTIVRMIGVSSTTIYTEDPTLPAKVGGKCPDVHARFVAPPTVSRSGR